MEVLVLEKDTKKQFPRIRHFDILCLFLSWNHSILPVGSTIINGFHTAYVSFLTAANLFGSNISFAL